MSCKRTKQHVFMCSVFLLVCLIGASAPATSATAQNSTKQTTEKWRPKDGLYASPGKDLDARCMESDYYFIDLTEKSVGGNEWSCKVTKLTDTAPDAIKLDMTCYDYNLAINVNPRDPNVYERQFKETMLLKKIGEKTIFARKTENGTFKAPGGNGVYCPPAAQRLHVEAAARDREAARYKVPEQLLRPEQWRPRDGVYASPGADFNDRCTKSGDVVIGLTEGAVLSGKAACKVVDMIIMGAASVSLTVACGQAPEKQAISAKTNNPETAKTKGTEAFRMSRIDDDTFVLQKSQNGEFKDAGGPVSYCPEEVQRTFTAQKKK